MVNYKEELQRLSDKVWSLKNDIESAADGNILFGAIGGSYSLGLQNKSSDIDCYFIMEQQENGDIVRLSQTIDGKKVDFCCVSFDAILREIDKYVGIEKRYPTVISRDVSENTPEEKEVLKDDLLRSILIRCILSTVIINRPKAIEKFQQFKDGIRVIDIIDNQFTRIYGNYNEQIIDKEIVPLRKYLYVIHEICICKSLMQTERIPGYDFIYLVRKFVTDEETRKHIERLYELNKSVTKDKSSVMVDCNLLINKYVEESMQLIQGFLADNGKLEKTILLR